MKGFPHWTQTDLPKIGKKLLKRRQSKPFSEDQASGISGPEITIQMWWPKGMMLLLRV